MKRFYKLISTEKSDDGYHILLDGRPVKTKAGVSLCAVNEAIASRIMKEWSEQGEEIIPDTMPFTQIVNTKIDRVSKERDAMLISVLKYLDTDLICYFASEPDELVKLQKEKWQVWLDWFERNFGCALHTTEGLSALTQSINTHELVSSYVHKLDDEHFTILQLVTSMSGSIILALALVCGDATAQEIFGSCFIEESYNDTLYDTEKYGADPILEKTKKAAMRDFQAAEDYISLLA